jgi:hypothetical protein
MNEECSNDEVSDLSIPGQYREIRASSFQLHSNFDISNFVIRKPPRLSSPRLASLWRPKIAPPAPHLPLRFLRPFAILTGLLGRLFGREDSRRLLGRSRPLGRETD